MKKYIVIILTLASLTPFAQNRFKPIFLKADSAFMETRIKTDSVNRVLFDSSIKIMDSAESFSIKLRGHQAIMLYWKGYTDCMIRNNETEKNDFNELKNQVEQLYKDMLKLSEQQKHKNTHKGVVGEINQ